MARYNVWDHSHDSLLRSLVFSASAAIRVPRRFLSLLEHGWESWLRGPSQSGRADCWPAFLEDVLLQEQPLGLAPSTPSPSLVFLPSGEQGIGCPFPHYLCIPEVGRLPCYLRGGESKASLSLPTHSSVAAAIPWCFRQRQCQDYRARKNLS